MEELIPVFGFAAIGYLTRMLTEYFNKEVEYLRGVTDGVHAVQHALGYCAFKDLGIPEEECRAADEVLARIKFKPPPESP